VLELPFPPPIPEGQVGAISFGFERVYPVEYESALASGETANGAFPGGQNLGWQGHWVDPVTGLDMVRARVYDPRTGAWLSRDPLEDVDSPNLYGYVAGRPHEATDPWGLESGATFGAIDRRERGVSAVPPSYTAQEKAAATQRALGCLAFGGGAAWTAFSGGALGGVLGGFALMSSGGAACFGKESPIGMVVRETANAAARSQGVEMTPATVRQQEENNAGVEGAVINLMVGFGTLAPGSPMPSGTTGTRSVSPLQEAGGLRRAAMDAHTAAGARTARAVRQSTVAIADVELQDGSRTYYAAGSGSRGLSPAQRELLQNAGVPEDNILTGARYTRGFLKDENHAERIIKRNLPEGAQVIDWGISWAERQKPVPCVKCEPHVSAAGGTLQR
jgi:RHS repeat-associated protein